MKTRLEAFLLGTSSAGAISGGDRHALEVLSAWSQTERYAVLLNVSRDGESTLRRFGYAIPNRVVSDRDRSGGLYFKWLVRCFVAVRTAIGAAPPDIVYASSPYFYDLLPALVLAKKRGGKRHLVVALFHVIPPPWSRSGSLVANTLAWLEQRLMIAVGVRRADLVVVDNQEVRQELARLGVDARRIYVSTMGIRPGDGRGVFAPIDGTYVGRLTEQKGIGTLLRAWRKVIDTLPSARLRLIGIPDQGFDIQAAIVDLGLQHNVEVLSDLDDEAVRAALQVAKFFVTASEEEGYGLSVLEALGAGIPVVSFDLPVFRFAFPRGRIVAQRRGAPALADAMISALLDPDYLRALRSEIADFPIPSWDDVADRIREHIR